MPLDNAHSASPRRPVWLIAGASSGIGQAIALQVCSWATVVAIGRNRSALEKLTKHGCKTLELDLTCSLETLREAVQAIVEGEGFIDVVVNASGYLLEGGVEETSETEMQQIFETHVFGPIRLTQSILPYMRRARRGTIAHIAGIGSLKGAANAGIFCASKAALSTTIEALQQEVAPLGIHVCLIQLGHFRTPFLSKGHRQKVRAHIADYDPILAPIRAAFDSFDGAQQGDPVKGARVIIEALTSQAEPVPFLLPVGPDVQAAELQAHEARAHQMLAVKLNLGGTDIE